MFVNLRPSLYSEFQDKQGCIVRLSKEGRGEERSGRERMRGSFNKLDKMACVCHLS